jgi:hypothetical protein
MLLMGRKRHYVYTNKTSYVIATVNVKDAFSRSDAVQFGIDLPDIRHITE